MKKLLLATAVMATLTTLSHARSLSYTCDGKVDRHSLSAYMVIKKDNGDSCIFITDSPEGKKILRTCPKDSQCSVEAAVEIASGENEIYKVTSVHRTGTPDMDARMKKAREIEEERGRAAVRPYAEKITDCITAHLKGAVTKDMLDDVLKKFCSRQRDALAKEYIKQFGPGGNYLYIDYLSDLPAQLSANAKRMTNIEHIERANKGTLPDVFIGSWCYDATGYTRATRAPRGPNVKGDDWVRTECKSAMTITARGWSGNTNTMGDTCTIQSFKDAPARARKNASIALSVTAKCEGEYWVGPTEFWIVLKNDGKMSKIWLE